MRTDFTQEIDGAMSTRNLGMRHYSEIARSGNGNMRVDLSEDLADYREVPGLGETVEQLSPSDSAQVDTYGKAAKIPQFRWPHTSEMPPYAAPEGSVWLRKKSLTDTRAPGGMRLAKVQWVLISKERLLGLQRAGELGDFPIGMTVSIGLGLVGGLLVWLALRRR